MVLVEVKVGRDGKRYLAKPLTEAERHRDRALAHGLVCRDRRTIRAAQQIMAGQYGIRRSVGAIARDLALFACPVCSE